MLCKENQWLAKTRKLQFVTPIWQRPSKCLTSKNMMFTTCSTFLCALDLQETNINILLRLVTWPAAAFNQIVWWSSVLTTLCELSSIGTRLTRFFNFKAFLWQKFEIIMVLKKKKNIFFNISENRSRANPARLKTTANGVCSEDDVDAKNHNHSIFRPHQHTCWELYWVDGWYGFDCSELKCACRQEDVWLPTGTKMPPLVEICEVSSQLQKLVNETC